jgi:hypothetical protein
VPARIVCDRLGGRRFYAPALAAHLPGATVTALEEIPAVSRYRITRGGLDHELAFRVGGEAASPLTALASCIAKYARELAMLLFNRWWCATCPGLSPTAGYPEDARRWLAAADPSLVGRWREELVRDEWRRPDPPSR